MTTPAASLLRDRVAYVLSVWFGCGLSPIAPGTAGTLGAIPLYLALRPAGLGAVALCAALVTAVGVWAAERVCRRSGQKDPQFVCIDEVAGVLWTWVAAPPGWRGLVAGVLVFRALDITKPWPVSWAERRLPGGWGIMFDDVLAGLLGAVVLLAARRAGWLG